MTSVHVSDAWQTHFMSKNGREKRCNEGKDCTTRVLRARGVLRFSTTGHSSLLLGRMSVLRINRPPASRRPRPSRSPRFQRFLLQGVRCALPPTVRRRRGRSEGRQSRSGVAKPFVQQLEALPLSFPQCLPLVWRKRLPFQPSASFSIVSLLFQCQATSRADIWVCRQQLSRPLCWLVASGFSTTSEKSGRNCMCPSRS